MAMPIVPILRKRLKQKVFGNHAARDAEKGYARA
jgi:hypothetical protein